MATKAEVERQLGLLMARLDGNEANVRSAIPTRKVLRCHVADLGADWTSPCLASSAATRSAWVRVRSLRLANA